jgi:type III restriction enzyme
MPQVIVPNPVLNSPFDEPTRHFFFDEDGITDKKVESRRLSSYFVPVPKPKMKGKQLALDTEWTQDRIEENKFINAVRNAVAKWRFGGYEGVTGATRQLLEYWRNPDRERRLYFCQIEALETAIYLAEAADRQGGAWISRDLKAANDSHNPLLERIAFKMATGSGKTVVMAMLIAWHALNKFASPQDSRFGDAFLIVTPGITIRDRLRVLLAQRPRELLPPRWTWCRKCCARTAQPGQDLHHQLPRFLPREKVAVGKLTKQVLGNAESTPSPKRPTRVVRRVCRGLGNKKNIVVINDEAHHCYRGKPRRTARSSRATSARKRRSANEEARVWITGLESTKRKPACAPSTTFRRRRSS